MSRIKRGIVCAILLIGSVAIFGCSAYEGPYANTDREREPVDITETSPPNIGDPGYPERPTARLANGTQAGTPSTFTNTAGPATTYGPSGGMTGARSGQ